VRRYTVEPKNNFNYWQNRIQILLEKFTNDYKLIPSDQKIDIFFDDLIKDNLNSIKKIYSKNSLSFNNLANSEIREYMNSNQRGKHGQVIYNLEDFNVDKLEFYRSFKFYFDTFDVLKEI
ncbi:MAG: hypothetical protein P8N39_04500, partial [SAR86 cluster bacterium]|nr:hypothetical protein [SAR86 cluster bacterium]